MAGSCFVTLNTVLVCKALPAALGSVSNTHILYFKTLFRYDTHKKVVDRRRDSEKSVCTMPINSPNSVVYKLTIIAETGRRYLERLLFFSRLAQEKITKSEF